MAFTGKKWEQKRYTWNTGYPGQRSETARDRHKRRPEQILREAVRRMLPKNRRGHRMLKSLTVYRTAEHPHSAQKPVLVEEL